MPAKSQAQQRFMGMVHAEKEGKLDKSKLDPEFAAKIEAIAKRIKAKDAEDLADTSHKNLPEKVKKASAMPTKKKERKSPGEVINYKEIEKMYKKLKKVSPPEGNSQGQKLASVEYRGHTFPGYNKPMKSWRKEKKKVVLAKKGDKVKIVHFGASGYGHNYSEAARKSYLARSAGIKGANDKFSANYWARKVLWAGKGGSVKSSPKGVQGKYASAKYMKVEKDRTKSERVIGGIMGGGVPSALLTGALNLGSLKKNPKGVLSSAVTAGAFGSAIGTIFSSPKKKTFVPVND